MAPDVWAARLAAADDPVVRRLADDGLYLGITAWTEPSLVESGELYPPAITTAEQRRGRAARAAGSNDTASDRQVVAALGWPPGAAAKALGSKPRSIRSPQVKGPV
jgi:hypothetical protein